MKKLILSILLIFISSFTLSAFSGCSAKEKYTLKTDDEGNKYYSVKLTGFTGNFSGEFVIPEYYGDGEEKAAVKEIEEQGFASTRLTKITIPKSVTVLGTAAFAFNSYLKEVVFNEGILLEELPHGTFGNCHSLENITLPDSVKKINAVAFGWCNSLTFLSLEHVEEIGTKAFEGCVSLSQVKLSSSLKKLGDCAFKESGLTSVIIPKSVKDSETTKIVDGKEVKTTEYGLGYATFYNCKQLKFAVIDADVECIPSGLFGECTALEEIYLPASIKEIQGAYYSQEKGGYLFGHPFFLTPLKKLNYAGTPSEWEKLKKNTDDKKATQNSITSDNSSLFSPSLVISFSTAYTPQS